MRARFSFHLSTPLTNSAAARLRYSRNDHTACASLYAVHPALFPAHVLCSLHFLDPSGLSFLLFTLSSTDFYLFLCSLKDVTTLPRKRRLFTHTEHSVLSGSENLPPRSPLPPNKPLPRRPRRPARASGRSITSSRALQLFLFEKTYILLAAMLRRPLTLPSRCYLRVKFYFLLWHLSFRLQSFSQTMIVSLFVKQPL